MPTSLSRTAHVWSVCIALLGGAVPLVLTGCGDPVIPDGEGGASGGAGAGGTSGGAGGGAGAGGVAGGVMGPPTGVGGVGGGGECVPRTCEEADAECGPIVDGCGDVVQCGDCTGPGQVCGGDGVPSKCSEGLASCIPQTCPDEACGLVADGCGNLLQCGTCSGEGESCGGGGVPYRCGVPVSDPDNCPALQTCPADVECGPVANGCGGVIDCGSCDEPGETCGGAGERYRCGDIASCMPQTCDDLGFNCGLAGDGCGNQINCGPCTEPGEICGGGGTPGVCGGGTYTCTPQNCEDQNLGCGLAGDGCGAQIDCGPCTEPGETCGGAGVPSQCGVAAPPPCTPNFTTCPQGWACGTALNNCGDTIDCGTCSGLEACIGGISGPTTCQALYNPVECPLCTAVPNCSGESQPTRLTGRVITPGRDTNNTGNQVGVPNAFVYILRTDNPEDLPAISSGIPSGGTSCDRCDEQDLGPVLASAVTDATGSYTLQGNVPVGAEFLLVVKVGKFRRAVMHTLPPEAACQTTALDPSLTRLPRTRTDGLAVNIPRIAVSTGQIDAMECVFEKMGIAHTEFANPGSGGSNPQRIHFYRGGPTTSSQGGMRINDNTPHDTDLYGSEARMLQYDMIIADCEGGQWDGANSWNQVTAWGDNVRRYVNRGGRMFASHLSFSWLYQNGEADFSPADPIATGLADAAEWQNDTAGVTSINTGTGIVSQARPRTSPRIDNFAAWMAHEGVAPPPARQFTITQPRSQALSLGEFTEEFVHCDGGHCTGDWRRTQQFSFNTPYGAPESAACGRVAYSGFHVVAGSGNPFNSVYFPAGCPSTDLTNQEKVLLYMLFDLGACVGEEPEPPSCVEVSCQDRGAECGLVADGCGATQSCGSCETGQACINNLCVDCQTRSCGTGQCGIMADGCGGSINCGDCPAGQVCGAGGMANQCVPECSPAVCDDPNWCGWIADGCGGAVDCGTCPVPQVCGAVTANRCDGCEALSCADVGAACGQIGNGCGGSVHCGTCPPGQVCGGGGTPNQCAPGVCTPLTCAGAGAECGLIGDGCDGTVDCGPCPQGMVCGGSGVPNECGGVCTPLTCDDHAPMCGKLPDGCGGLVTCGCPTGQSCGFITPNQCGGIG